MSTSEMFACKKGSPQPYGATCINGAINFAVYSKHASRMKLCLFQAEDSPPVFEIELDPSENKTGNVWHIQLKGLPDPLFYAFQPLDPADPSLKQSYPAGLLLLDPYAKGTSASSKWGSYPKKGKAYRPLGAVVCNQQFDWENDKLPNIPYPELIIYEMHVRAFTQDPSSNAKAPGTYLGVIEKIPHLVQLGINAVELLPIHEFYENENMRTNPVTKQQLCNFWGYSTVNFFSPMNRYASSAKIGAAILEFKAMVKELHKHGIEVILDVVYNHTAEGNDKGPILSFKGLANSDYYMVNGDKNYQDYTGCGNTLNCNEPVTLELILASLRYWVTEMHVDGFRFDLASILTRAPNGEPMPMPPLVEAISKDPVLASTKMMAEAWDAAGLYQVGSFYPGAIRWSEWNGRYRDTVRRYIKGTPGVKGDFVTRLCGSHDLYHNRAPFTSINFVTVHDGFTLADLVSYNHKHNSENAENNLDGNNFNDSWNCGAEGPTDNAKILALRGRQMRNYHLVLMVSIGVPLLLMGDEYGHTKQGNNNTWCQDNKLNWFLWDQLERNSGFHRFYRLAIRFRRQHAVFHRSTFLSEQDVQWHGVEIDKPRWEEQDQFVAYTLKDQVNNEDLYIAFNARDETAEVELPPDTPNMSWHWIVDTGKPSPEDFLEPCNALPAVEKKYKMVGHSAILLKLMKTR